MNTCSETIDKVTQSRNTLTATGDFNTGGQPILTLQKGTSSQVITSSGHDLTTATFDITGIPPGVYTATWDLSCDGIPDVTSHVSTITIQWLAPIHWVTWAARATSHRG